MRILQEQDLIKVGLTYCLDQIRKRKNIDWNLKQYIRLRNLEDFLNENDN